MADQKTLKAHEKRKAQIAQLKKYGLEINDLKRLLAARAALLDCEDAVVRGMVDRPNNNLITPFAAGQMLTEIVIALDFLTGPR